MFTLSQIAFAHSKVKSGADFPSYIQGIKQLGVSRFETWVSDSHTDYFGANNFQLSSESKYGDLTISDLSNKNQFIAYLKIHQKGETDYMQFCNHCAETGIEKWIVCLNKMTCVYYDKVGNEILVEQIPSVN